MQRGTPQLIASDAAVYAEQRSSSADAPPFGAREAATLPVDLTAEIVENNAELTEKIADAIALASSISGLAPAAAAASAPRHPEGLLPRAGGPASAPASAARRAARPADPAPGPGELSLLSLLSASYNLLTPNDLALPLNDPSIFLPTPFAPGENATTLSQQQRDHGAPAPPRRPAGPSPAPRPRARPEFYRRRAAAPPPPAPRPVDGARQELLYQLAALQPPPARLPGARQELLHQLAAARPPPAPIPAAHPRQELLHQLAAAPPPPGPLTSERQDLLHQLALAMYPPPAGVSASPTPQSFLHLYPQNSAGLNHLGIGRMSAWLNPPGTAAGLPAGYHRPGMTEGVLAGFSHQGRPAGAPAGYYHPGIDREGPAGLNYPGMTASTPAGARYPRRASFSHTGSLPPESTTSASATRPAPAAHACVGPRASPARKMPLPQEPSSGAGAEAPAARPGPGDPAPPQSAAADAGSAPASPAGGAEGKGGDDPFLKSREARWIARYEQLLEFRVAHGHCRVPHGYGSNRKLSWWVMNQRAQFAHRGQGRKTWLTDERIRLLNDAGFIWTPHLKRAGGGRAKDAAPAPAGAGRRDAKEG